jgi:hypothetical protein
MSKPTNRDTAPGDGGPVEVRRARVVPHLAPETLYQLVQFRGLEACGDLVTAATPAQLTSLLDIDLWRHAQPGPLVGTTGDSGELFDDDRFGEWLEVLVDTGDSARIVAALDRDLVILGLSRCLRVFDPGIFEPTESTDDEPADRHEMMSSETSNDVLECEVGGYLVRAERRVAWDAIVTLLVTLEAEDGPCFHAIMQGCRRLSNSTPEKDGLDDLLLAPAQHLHDARIEREKRRSTLGYATPADARVFLHEARQGVHKLSAATSSPQNAAPADGGHAGDAIAIPVAARLPHLKRLLEFLLQRDEATYLTRGRELAALANTLMAGSSLQSRPFTPREASDAAACVCNLGLESLPDRLDHDLTAAFEAGWSRLYRDVSLCVADQLLAILAGIRCADGHTRLTLHAFRRKLANEREAGKPWLALDAADVLATLDVTAWVSVVGLLGECPVLPAALTAVLERRTTPVSPTAFEFISTTAQIGDVRLFMKTLPGVLGTLR